MPIRALKRPFLFFVALLLTRSPLWAMEHVTVTRDGQRQYVDGRTVLTARDGGVLFLARDGALWRILPSELEKRTKDDAPFRAFSSIEMTAAVKAQLPKGFDVYHTMHYLIVYDTSRAYAQWCGALFERLYMAFCNAWTRQGFALVKPEFPLVAVIFSDKASYVKYAEKDFGDEAGSTYGYYNMETNRMATYDLVGVAANRPGRSLGLSQINQFLASPNAPGAVSTIVHEATHQIAFNCGLHQRLSDCPKWFSEGIAMYCETPDLGRGKGWAGLGVVNRTRLMHFMEYLPQRPANSLKTLIGEDKRFVDPKQAIEAYAEAWALTYYLLHKHPKQYIAYLEVLSRKQPLVYDDKAKRLAEFEKQFGPPEKLDADFVNFTRALVR